MVAPQTNTVTRMKLRTTLANNNVPGFNGLSTEEFDSKVFRVRVAAVTRGTYAFLCAMKNSLLLSITA